MKAKPATPLEVAKYGRTASLLRQFMQQRGMAKTELATALGYNKHAGHIYNWIASKGGPGPDSRKKLAKLFGNKPADWLADNLHPGVPAASQQQAIAARPPRIGHTLSFYIMEDGRARLQLDITTSFKEGTDLLRIILDAQSLKESANG